MVSWLVFFITAIGAAYYETFNSLITPIVRVANGIALLGQNSIFESYRRVRLALNLIHSASPSLTAISYLFIMTPLSFPPPNVGVLTLLQNEFMEESTNFHLSIHSSLNESSDGRPVKLIASFSVNCLAVNSRDLYCLTLHRMRCMLLISVMSNVVCKPKLAPFLIISMETYILR